LLALTTGVRIRSWASSCEICSGTGTDFSLGASDFLYHYHSTDALHSSPSSHYSYTEQEDTVSERSFRSTFFHISENTEQKGTFAISSPKCSSLWDCLNQFLALNKKSSSREANYVLWVRSTCRAVSSLR
jgi:hypothetical protein